MKKILRRIVKYLLIATVLYMLSPITARADEKSVSGFTQSVVRAKSKNKTVYVYQFSREAMGRFNGRLGIDTLTEETYRTAIQFPTGNIPTNATITEAVLHYTTETYNDVVLTFKMNDFNSSSFVWESDIWNDAGTGTTYKSGLTTSPYSQDVAFTKTNDPTFIAAIQSSLATGYLYVGFASETEGTDQNLITSFIASLTVKYTVPPATYRIYVKNSFNSGNVIVDYISYPSGKYFDWLEGTTHTLTAIDRPYIQELPGKFYYRIYQNWADPRGNPIVSKPNLMASIKVTGGGTYTANFKKEFNLTFSNSFGGGQVIVNGTTQNSGYLLPLEEKNSVSFSTQSDYSISGYYYHYINWTVNGTVVTSPNTPTDHTNYIANYTKSLWCVSFTGSSVHDENGNHPRLTWTAHEAQDVIGYNVYMKYGKTGSFGIAGTVIGRTNTSFVDYGFNIINGGTIATYIVKAYTSTMESGYDHNVTYYGQYAAKVSVSNQNSEFIDVPASVALEQNFPNPFNPSTEIHFSLPDASHVKLSVFDLLGREVALLVDGERSAGYYSVQFDGKSLPSGIYFYRLQAGTYTEIKKMQLIK